MAIYQKAFDIIERYFGSEDGDDDQNIAPTINAAAEEYSFNSQVKGSFQVLERPFGNLSSTTG